MDQVLQEGSSSMSAIFLVQETTLHEEVMVGSEVEVEEELPFMQTMHKY